jgi:hypothetical protein
VPREEAAVFHAAASLAVARIERRRNQALFAALGTRDIAKWLRRVEKMALLALERRGEATAQELAKEVPALQRKVRVNEGKAYAGDIGLSGRVLLLMALEGKVVRGRPRGTWVSSQYRWAPMTQWLGSPLEPIPVEEAQTEVIRQWLARFGPGTETDLRWWTGWTAAVVRRALEELEAVEVDLDGRTGFVLPHDTDSTPRPKPWIALLPSLDPTTMGWKDREWYLGDYKARLFDASGNAGPTIWCNGRIVGGWAIRANGVVVTRLLEDIGREASSAVEREAERLTTWLQATRAIPRFPTPLHKELIAD